MYIRMLLIRSHLSGLDLAGMTLSWQLKCTSIKRPFIVWGDNYARLQNLLNLISHVSHDRSVGDGKYLQFLREFHLLKGNP
jgi:hypothetical protein